MSAMSETLITIEEVLAVVGVNAILPPKGLLVLIMGRLGARLKAESIPAPAIKHPKFHKIVASIAHDLALKADRRGELWKYGLQAGDEVEIDAHVVTINSIEYAYSGSELVAKILTKKGDKLECRLKDIS